MVRPERRRALHEALADLRRYRRTYSRERFMVERDPQRLVLQALYTAVQACVDEALEICRERGLAAGDTYRDAFIALGQQGLLDAELAGHLADWASFRNILAHFYPILDLDRVWMALDDLDELDRFASWAAQQRP